MLFKEIIKNYFKNNNFTTSTCGKFLRLNSTIKNEVEKILNDIPEYLSLYQVVKYIINDETLPKCLNCGKYIDSNIHARLKRKFGYFYCKECNQLKEVKTKIRLSSLPKFKSTMIKKYGVEFSAQSNELDKKRENTCLERYGSKYAINSNEVKAKIKKTIISKYDVDNFSKFYKKETLEIFKNYLIPLFNEDDYLNDTNNLKNNYQWKCKKCGNVFETHIHKTMHIPEVPYLPRCLNCYPKLKGTSKLEKELLDFIKEIYNGEILENDRSVIKPFELDMVILEKKIAFEFNGTFWHSESSPGFDKNKNKCLMKTNLCNETGYKLIHIWEYDWINSIKQNILKEKIKALLGVDQTKIYARKCEIKEIDSKIKNEFLNKHHIQGEDKSKVKLGLFYENQLVAVMTFGKPRFNNNYEWELIRYATKSGCQVLGGAGKLLSYFERNYNPKSIITYADRSYSQGNMYKQIGFNLVKITEPSYVWVNDGKILSRYQCQKHKLKKILGDKFDQKLSENENMSLNGFFKIFDCGNLIFVKK